MNYSLFDSIVLASRCVRTGWSEEESGPSFLSFSDHVDRKKTFGGELYLILDNRLQSLRTFDFNASSYHATSFLLIFPRQLAGLIDLLAIMSHVGHLIFLCAKYRSFKDVQLSWLLTICFVLFIYWRAYDMFWKDECSLFWRFAVIYLLLKLPFFETWFRNTGGARLLSTRLARAFTSLGSNQSWKKVKQLWTCWLVRLWSDKKACEK
jgi:hypothetical protein